jgi:hypothetical protein
MFLKHTMCWLASRYNSKTMIPCSNCIYKMSDSQELGTIKINDIDHRWSRFNSASAILFIIRTVYVFNHDWGSCQLPVVMEVQGHMVKECTSILFISIIIHWSILQ